MPRAEGLPKHAGTLCQLLIVAALAGCTAPQAPAEVAPGDPQAIRAAPGGSWLQYGVDLRNTQENPAETLLSRTTVSGLSERWRLHVLDGASSTPLVLDGSAYFGDWGGRVYAVDAESGELRWQRRVTQGQVNSTLLASADRVYATGGASLFALARSDGAPIFETLLDRDPTALVWSSPKLIDGLIVVGVASFENGISLEPAFNGSVVALDAISGKEIWRVYTTGSRPGRCQGGPGVGVWSSASFDEALGLMFIGTGQGYNEPVGNCADALLAIDYRRETVGERIRWIAQYSEGDVFGLVNLFTGRDADVGAAPNLFEAGGRKLVGAGDKGGSYRTFDRATGEPVWRSDLGIGLHPGFGGVVTTAAVDQDSIYVASNLIENVQFLSGGAPTADDGAMLFALDTATGQPRWRVEMEAPIAGTFALANGVLYHSLANRRVYARDVSTGEPLWSAELQNIPGAGPSVVDGRLYISAGMSLSAVLPTEAGGFVSSFALGDQPLQTRDAPAEELMPLTEAQCLESRGPLDKPEACDACLCACDATAAGHCGQCESLASCTVVACGLASGDAALRECMSSFCNAKLLPSFVFERAIDLAPCMTRCALTCGY
jgi:polyvinyl alcohol dehydrogenase (cytochrome)